MSGIAKTAHVLADGRELFYFDDADTTLDGHRSIDERKLDPRPATPRMRQDVLTGEWISIADGRQDRVVLPPPDRDPLAPQSPGNASEIPDNYDVAVFENRSPAFGPTLGEESTPDAMAEVTGLGLSRERAAIGRCEVVCFAPGTTGSLAELSESRVRTVIEALADRTAALSELPGVQQVFPFENRGEQIGVTLQHPHGQIYAYPFVTPRTTRLIRSVEQYGPDLFEDLLVSELASDRVVLAGRHWSAFVPFAARWPLEVHLLPHRHVPDLAETNDEERDELAVLYRRILRGLDALYDTPTPYIAAWHQAPVISHRGEIRLMLQLVSPRRAVDKLKYLAASEATMGAWIADVTPEAAAQQLREGIERS